MGPQHPGRGGEMASATDTPGPPKIQLRDVSVYYGEYSGPAAACRCRCTPTG